MENNKLLGEFLGRTGKANKLLYAFKNLEYNGQIWFNDSELRFHNDWNWLMEVVRKIKEIIGHTTIDECDNEEWRIITNLTRLSITSSISEVYNACVEYVKYHNIKNN